MKKQLLKKLWVVAIGIMGVTSVANAQHWLAEVSGQVATFNGEYRGNHLAVDAGGNTYTTGSFKSSTTASLSNVSAYSSGQTHPSGTIAFTANNTTTPTTTPATATKDNSFIAKTNPNGAFEWMVGFGSTAVKDENTVTNTIAVDNANNVLYVGGKFNGTLALSNTFPSATPAITNPTGNGTDGLLLKMTTAGAYGWHKILGGSGTQAVIGVATDKDGNLIVMGTYSTELTIDNTTITIPTGNGTDVFIAKFNPAGTLLFIKSIGGTGADAGIGLAVDVDKAIYISGSFLGNMLVRADDPITPADETISLTSPEISTTPTYATNSYIAKFDADGNALWAKSVVSKEANIGYSVAVDNKSDLTERRVYLVGHINARDLAAVTAGNKINFAGVDFVLAEGSTSPYISKFRAHDGAGVWGKVFNSIGTGASGGYLASVNANNEVYFGGFVRTSTNFDGYVHSNTDNGDGYIIKVDDNGNVIGRKFIATVGTDYVCGLVATNTAIYANGIAGGPATNGATPPVNASVASPTVTANFAGTGQPYTFRGVSWDIYILKWGDATLPVSLTDFKGSKTTSGNQLSWNTLSESNNAHFEVERSTDAVNFTSLQTINTKAVSGNSTAKLSYSYTDVSPLAGANYYRLKQVDNDGKFAYSENVVAINNSLSENKEIKIYPNPGSGNITIQFSTESVGREVNVYNQAGQFVKSYAEASGNSHAIDITAQPSGIYFIQVLEKGKSNLIKYIKQ